MKFIKFWMGILEFWNFWYSDWKRSVVKATELLLVDSARFFVSDAEIGNYKAFFVTFDYEKKPEGLDGKVG